MSKRTTPGVTMSPFTLLILLELTYIGSLLLVNKLTEVSVLTASVWYFISFCTIMILLLYSSVRAMKQSRTLEREGKPYRQQLNTAWLMILIFATAMITVASIKILKPDLVAFIWDGWVFGTPILIIGALVALITLAQLHPPSPRREKQRAKRKQADSMNSSRDVKLETIVNPS